MEGNCSKSEPLIFPRGVRFPLSDEIPGDANEVLSRIANAQITTGYIVTKVEGKLYNTYIEANVHAPNVFEVFKQLAFALMPNIAAPIVGIKEDEPIFGPYINTVLAVEVFQPHTDLLQNDGFLEFGIVHQSEFAFEEVFVTSPKYFSIWTNHCSRVEDVLQSNNIPKCEELEFIDEYPMVSLSLGDGDSVAWSSPFYAIQDEFSRLSKSN